MGERIVVGRDDLDTEIVGAEVSLPVAAAGDYDHRRRGAPQITSLGRRGSSDTPRLSAHLLVRWVRFDEHHHRLSPCSGSRYAALAS